MLLENEDYRPVNIEFEVASNQIPENLGQFENEKELKDFVNENLVAINEKITAIRFIDATEKHELRTECLDLLENKLPFQKKDLQKAEIQLKQAKDLVSELKQAVEATSSEAENLAVQVKIGTKEMNLDDKFTWRVPYEDKFYYFTFLDKQLKLAKIKDIPEHEKRDIFNDQTKNSIFFDSILENE